MISRYQQELLNRLAEKYSREMFSHISEALRKYDRTGKTSRSLKVRWLKSTDREPPRILVVYELQAALFNVRRMSWVRVPNVEKLLEWSENINFNQVPGYKNGLAPNLPPWKIKERIVSAIAFDKRKNDTWKPKPWRRMALKDVLKRLNRETIQAYNREVEEVLTEALETGKTS